MPGGEQVLYAYKKFTIHSDLKKLKYYTNRIPPRIFTNKIISSKLFAGLISKLTSGCN